MKNSTTFIGSVLTIRSFIASTVLIKSTKVDRNIGFLNAL